MYIIGGWTRTSCIGSTRAIDHLAAAIISLHEQGTLGDIRDPVGQPQEG